MINVLILGHGKLNTDRANGVNQVLAGTIKYIKRLHKGSIRLDVLTISSCVKPEIIKKEYCTFKTFPTIYSIHFFRTLLRKICDADVVHIHNPLIFKNILFVALSWISGKKIVVTCHDCFDKNRYTTKVALKKMYMFGVAKLVLPLTNMVVAITSEERDQIRRVTKSDICVIPNGVDLDEYSDDRIASDKYNDNVVGYIGRISPEKNIKSLIDAIIKYNNVFVNSKLYLKIAGPIDEYAQSLINEYRANIYISFVGPLYTDAKIDFIQGCNLVVQPSVCDVFSIAAIEVLACKRLLLISSGCKLQDYRIYSCFYETMPDADSIFNSLQQIFNNQNIDRHKHCVENGRRLVTDKLNWAAISKIYVQLYNQI